MIAPRHTPARPEQLIKPGHFFSTDEEKVKLNWFLFEYACEMEAFIRRDKKLLFRLRQEGADDQAVAAFCIHHAKQMKGQVLARIAGETSHVSMDYKGIEVYFPRIGDDLVDRLLLKAAEAWDEMTGKCSVCPTRCISEKDDRATMFDDPFYWG